MSANEFHKFDCISNSFNLGFKFTEPINVILLIKQVKFWRKSAVALRYFPLSRAQKQKRWKLRLLLGTKGFAFKLGRRYLDKKRNSNINDWSCTCFRNPHDSFVLRKGIRKENKTTKNPQKNVNFSCLWPTSKLQEQYFGRNWEKREKFLCFPHFVCEKTGCVLTIGL